MKRQSETSRQIDVRSAARQKACYIELHAHIRQSRSRLFFSSPFAAWYLQIADTRASWASSQLRCGAHVVSAVWAWHACVRYIPQPIGRLRCEQSFLFCQAFRLTPTRHTACQAGGTRGWRMGSPDYRYSPRVLSLVYRRFKSSKVGQSSGCSTIVKAYADTAMMPAKCSHAWMMDEAVRYMSVQRSG